MDVPDIILDNSKIISVVGNRILSIKNGIEKYYEYLIDEKEN